MGYSPWGHKESDTTEAIEHACIGRLEVPGTAPPAPAPPWVQFTCLCGSQNSEKHFTYQPTSLL